MGDSRGFLGAFGDAGAPSRGDAAADAAANGSAAGERVEAGPRDDDRDRKPGDLDDLDDGRASHDPPAVERAGEPVDVTASLASALARASEAGRWDVVALLAKELEARRLASAGNVVAIGAKRRP